jgi:hypothetical protein
VRSLSVVQIWGTEENNYLFFLVALTYVSFSSAQPQQGIGKSHHIATICGVTVGSVAFMAFVVGILLWWRHRRNQQIFFDVNGNVLFYSVPV